MTTTLRPTVPEQRTDGGGRARSYEVCVNSRPVGSVRLATDARLGRAAGCIERLHIDEAERHRGRGTVAALAAEEVLRGWGCTQLVVNVPARATTALGLASALGYRERGRNMLKRLTEPPELPGDSAIRPMAAAEYPAWRAKERTGYIADLLERGLSREQAETKADTDYARLLPQGPDTPGALLRILAHSGTDLGTLWLALRLGEPEAAEDGEAYVFAVEVAAEHRGHGHGRTLMLAAERESLAHGAHSLGLRVFGGNTPALRLYESLGYEPTQYEFYKPLL
ncbi:MULTISPECIES: GNAT family N-acetyltransferase [Streptomyces]|uniref:GNAT family N-acetyltransferase n=1 Tax=Streptomyces TaxID=1883 RepID=UPI001E55BE7A|nr:GNAT family N-acetyltransferase [Streptomyces sp. 8ZJF_21]MCC4315828.1 GNAT family N-acetyltransferase [Streptomyces malaysiensis]MCD9587840.1 GNAT family N-acetyltransferase [Streptomyces sp. 8ZJF_21]